MLSSSSQYAIRALAHLAQRPERSEWMLARSIAEQLGIPASFLAKVLQTLTAQGVLESQRGRRGGFRLRRDPDRLSLFEVVELFDRLGQGRLCVLGQKVCDDDGACPLHYTWKHSVDAFIHRLRTTSLADVASDSGSGSFPAHSPAPPPIDAAPG